MAVKSIHSPNACLAHPIPVGQCRREGVLNPKPHLLLHRHRCLWTGTCYLPHLPGPGASPRGHLFGHRGCQSLLSQDSLNQGGREQGKVIWVYRLCPLFPQERGASLSCQLKAHNGCTSTSTLSKPSARWARDPAEGNCNILLAKGSWAWGPSWEQVGCQARLQKGGLLVPKQIANPGDPHVHLVLRAWSAPVRSTLSLRQES